MNVALDTCMKCKACRESETVGESTFIKPNLAYQSDVSGLAYYNSCSTYIGSYACSSDKDCPYNYACITGSAGRSNSTSALGAPVYLPMMRTPGLALECRSPD